MAVVLQYPVFLPCSQRMSRSGVIMAALAMLPDEDDQQALTQVVLQINSWHHTAHSSPYRASTGCLIGPTALHGSVVRLCAYSYLGACMHSTAMEQLNGSRPVGDWEPVRQVKFVWLIWERCCGSCAVLQSPKRPCQLQCTPCTAASV